MLAKLMKYELKSGYILFPCLFLALLVLYGFGLFTKALNLTILTGILTAFLVIIGIGICLMAFIFVAIRYYKSVFGAEGYLTQTLPVSSGKIILSKFVLGYAAILLSYVIAILTIAATCTLSGGNPMEWFKGANPNLTASLFGFILFSVLFKTAAVVGEIFLAITLAHTRPFAKNSILFSVAFFIVFSLTVGLLEIIGIIFIPAGLHFTQSSAHFAWEGMLPYIQKGIYEANVQANSASMSIKQSFNGVTIGFGSYVTDCLSAIVLLLLSKKLLAHKTSI